MMLNLYNFNDTELKDLLKTLVIIIDTREQNNKHIIDFLNSKKIKYIEKKLDFGDYTCMIPANIKTGIHRDLYFNNICTIERKGSLVELSGNFTKERQRMAHEFSRAKGQLTLLIEAKGIEDIITHNYTTQYAPASFLATLLTYESRYGFNTKFISKEYSGLYIYQILYYAVRQWLKGEG